jgi:Na+/H+-translocating membrane pyrophosphatase
MKKYGVAFIFVAALVLVMLMTPFSSVTAQPMCGPKPAMVESILNKFNEKETEYGIDGRSASYVGVYVNAKTKDFTFTMTPKGQPSILCAIATGTQWEQLPGISKGIISDGSLISISYNEESGLWQLMYVNIETGNISMVTSGNSWERAVEFTDPSI